MFTLGQTLLTVLLPTSHLVQQKATQEYAKICVGAEIWVYPWHCILELKYYFPTKHRKTEDLKKQHGRERERDDKLLYKKDTWGGLQAQKAKMSQQKREHSSKSREWILRETWERKLRHKNSFPGSVWGSPIKVVFLWGGGHYSPFLELSSEDQ